MRYIIVVPAVLLGALVALYLWLSGAVAEIDMRLEEMCD